MNRHDRRKAKKMEKEFPASAKQRVLTFLAAFRSAPDDADIEVRTGTSNAGEPALLVSFSGTEHAMLVSEARKVADIMEDTMNAFPDEPDGRSLPNIIMGLRHGCDEAERTVR